MAQNSDRKPVAAIRRVRTTSEAPKPKRARTEALARHGSNIMTVAEYDKLIGDRMSEDAWREHYRRFAFDCGFKRQYHTYRSDRSDRGFPDDVMLNVITGRMVYIEGKRESGVLSYDQVLWLDDLATIRDMAGIPEVYVARPSDKDGLWAVLAGWKTDDLHGWCLDRSCERCGEDRRRAVVRLPGGKRVRANSTVGR